VFPTQHDNYTSFSNTPTFLLSIYAPSSSTCL